MTVARGLVRYGEGKNRLDGHFEGREDYDKTFIRFDPKAVIREINGRRRVLGQNGKRPNRKK